MANENLQFVIEAKDQASAALKNVSANAEKVSGSVKKLGDFFNSAASSSKIFTGVIVGIGAGLVAFGKKSVDAFAESERAVAQLGAVLKSTGGAVGLLQEDILEQATALQAMTGASDEAIISGQNMLLTFTNIKGGVFQEATQTLLDMTTAMQGGIPTAEALSAQAISLGKALNDPIKGLTALTRVGVTFNAEQVKQIETMVKAGDIMGAQRLMLAELNREYGGSAEAIGKTFSGSLEIAKQNFGDLMEVIGEGIVETIRPMIVAFNEWFANMGGSQAVFDFLQEKFTWLQENLPVIIGLIVGGMTPAVLALAGAFVKLVAPLSPFLLAGAAIGLLMKQLDIDFKDVAKSILDVWENIKSLFSANEEMSGSFLKAHPLLANIILALKDFWAQLKVAWGIVKEFLLPEIQKLIENLDWLWPILGTILVGAIKAAGIAIQAVVLFIHGFVVILNTVIDTVKSVIKWFGDAKTTITGAWTTLWEDLKRTAAEAVNTIIRTVNQLSGGLLNLPTIDIKVKKTITEVTKQEGGSSDLAKGFIKAATGGIVPGRPNGGRDTVRALLSPGELVLNEAQQKALANRVVNNNPTVTINLGGVTIANGSDEESLIRKIQESIFGTLKLMQQGVKV